MFMEHIIIIIIVSIGSSPTCETCSTHQYSLMTTSLRRALPFVGFLTFEGGQLSLYIANINAGGDAIHPLAKLTCHLGTISIARVRKLRRSFNTDGFLCYLFYFFSFTQR